MTLTRIRVQPSAWNQTIPLAEHPIVPLELYRAGRSHAMSSLRRVTLFHIISCMIQKDLSDRPR